MAPRAAAEQGGLRRHATLRKVLAVASLAGLAYLAKGAAPNSAHTLLDRIEANSNASKELLQGSLLWL